MDEPTSALDPISTSKIEDLAVDLKDKYTIIMVTHNMQQAARISDNTAFSCSEKLWSLTIQRNCSQIQVTSGQRIISQEGLVDEL